mmetsp:Transcript_24469/g.38697  ORF Transcript_24469/g.38697 Transcript_24469/m.38697 type:complete len:143 (+) Transcript_24469:78-506(+)
MKTGAIASSQSTSGCVGLCHVELMQHTTWTFLVHTNLEPCGFAFAACEIPCIPSKLLGGMQAAPCQVLLQAVTGVTATLPLRLPLNCHIEILQILPNLLSFIVVEAQLLPELVMHVTHSALQPWTWPTTPQKEKPVAHADNA